MDQPEGFVEAGMEDHVRELQRCFHGMKQGGLVWNHACLGDCSATRFLISNGIMFFPQFLGCCPIAPNVNLAAESSIHSWFVRGTQFVCCAGFGRAAQVQKFIKCADSHSIGYACCDTSNVVRERVPI